MSKKFPQSASVSRVFDRYADLKYIQRGQAEYLREFLLQHQLTDLMELGCFHGKSSAVMASVLDEMGRGHLTTFDLVAAKRRKPCIEEVLSELGLSHRVSPVYAHRSFTWELCRQLKDDPTPRFDFCYIDGAHTWDGTGFSFFLVDMLLRPGGWVIFDDLDWSIRSSAAANSKSGSYAEYSDEEKAAKQVREVWELLVPARGYQNIQEVKDFHWGVAQKPHASPQPGSLPGRQSWLNRVARDLKKSARGLLGRNGS